MKLIVAVTASVAAIKVPELVESLKRTDGGLEIKIVLTNNADHFVADCIVTRQDGQRVISDCPVYCDADEWSTWRKRGDPVLHIDMRHWADCVLIAPLSANTLAKLASGICDNLLTSMMRAWDLNKPTLLCPAMNTHMWTHPLTAQHLKFCQETLNFFVIPPVSKVLMCGDFGIGAMASVETIVEAVKTASLKNQ